MASTYINLIRDKETGKSKGFAFLKYVDQRSTDLAVDNLGGASILGRVLKVDHTRYKKKDEDEGVDLSVMDEGANAEAKEERGEERRPMLKEEKELAMLIRDHDEDDPMKEYLVKEKRKEVAQALAKLEKGSKSRDRNEHKHHHRHHHRHRPRRHSTESGTDEERSRRRRHERKGSRYP